jgi:dihydroorotate dehydrogenase (NAD+) catalytic subunit
MDGSSQSPQSPSPLAVSLAGIDLRNPIILAAGTAGLVDDVAGVIDLSLVGALTTKSITPLPREGNDTWRVLPAGAAGMLNAVGLANPGLDAFLRDSALKARNLPCRVFVSVAGFSIDDYVQCAANIDAFIGDCGGPASANLHAIELNVSCPNVKTGTEFGHTPALLADLLSAVRRQVRHAKLFAKLSPATPDLMGVVRSACDNGADAVTLGNTYPAMAIDVETRRPTLSNTTGGLSGPALHPISLKHVHDAHRRVMLPRAEAKQRITPIVGAGGVASWQQGAAYILAGATAFQMGTALFADPRAPKQVEKGLRKWVERQGVGGIGELVGAVRLRG